MATNVDDKHRATLISVKQLKEFLKDIPDDYIIETEGCDCWGTVGRLQTNHHERTIELLRD